MRFEPEAHPRSRRPLWAPCALCDTPIRPEVPTSTGESRPARDRARHRPSSCRELAVHNSAPKPSPAGGSYPVTRYPPDQRCAATPFVLCNALRIAPISASFAFFARRTRSLGDAARRTGTRASTGGDRCGFGRRIENWVLVGAAHRPFLSHKASADKNPVVSMGALRPKVLRHVRLKVRLLPDSQVSMGALRPKVLRQCLETL